MQVLLIALALAQAPQDRADVDETLYPATPLIERTRFGQALNFDVEIINNGAATLDLTAIRALVRDPSGRIVQALEINDNGGAPGIQTVPTRTWKPGESHTIYNPFHTLSSDIRLGALDYDFVFTDEKKQKLVQHVQVRPAAHMPRTRLVLPMPGRVLVWDGHDFYSHHRRFDFSHPAIKQLGIRTNPGRYSFDFVIIDGEARFHRPDPAKHEDYFSYGARIVAPADGVVVALMNDASNEPAEPTRAAFRKDPMTAIYGNYIVIDHGNGEFSQLGHLKRGSVGVSVGERVRQGQQIAEAGASGTSLFPHLHYQLTNGPGIDAEGLPAYFDGVVRPVASQAETRPQTWIDTGDIIETVSPRP